MNLWIKLANLLFVIYKSPGSSNIILAIHIPHSEDFLLVLYRLTFLLKWLRVDQTSSLTPTIISISDEQTQDTLIPFLFFQWLILKHWPSFLYRKSKRYILFSSFFPINSNISSFSCHKILYIPSCQRFYTSSY